MTEINRANRCQTFRHFTEMKTSSKWKHCAKYRLLIWSIGNDRWRARRTEVDDYRLDVDQRSGAPDAKFDFRGTGGTSDPLGIFCLWAVVLLVPRTDGTYSFRGDIRSSFVFVCCTAFLSSFRAMYRLLRPARHLPLSFVLFIPRTDGRNLASVVTYARHLSLSVVLRSSPRSVQCIGFCDPLVICLCLLYCVPLLVPYDVQAFATLTSFTFVLCTAHPADRPTNAQTNRRKPSFPDNTHH